MPVVPVMPALYVMQALSVMQALLVMPAVPVMPAKAGIQLIDFRLRENDGLGTNMTVWV